MADTELELLLACCRVNPAADEIAQIQARAAAVVNWPRLVRLAHRHQVVALAFEALRVAELEKAPAIGILAETRRKHAGHNLLMARELGQLLDAFRDAGIASVPFKGLALAEKLYGGPLGRWPGDLDLLVQPHSLTAAEAVLASRGYERYSEARRGDFYDRAYIREADRAVVELHWLLQSACSGRPRTSAELWPLLIPARVTGRQVLSFPPELYLVLLVEHGTRHAWNRLKWLCDVAELLRSTPELDWRQVERFCDRADSRRSLALALLLATTAFSVSLPTDKVGTRSNAQVTRIAREITEAWSVEEIPKDRFAPRWHYSMILTEGVGPQVWSTLRQVAALTWPSAADRDWVTLPRWLEWAYPAIRVARVAVGLFQPKGQSKE